MESELAIEDLDEGAPVKLREDAVSSEGLVAPAVEMWSELCPAPPPSLPELSAPNAAPEGSTPGGGSHGAAARSPWPKPFGGTMQ